MNHHRLLVLPAVAALAFALTACVGLPFPLPGGATPSPVVPAVDPQTVDVRAAEDLMREALPVAPADFDVENSGGLGEQTFASDWSVVDHDARRVARVLRTSESPGWADYSRGPGYVFDVEIVLMESTDAAGAAYNEIASAVAQPYEYTSDDETLRTEYAPLPEPSGRWPFGTVEQATEQTWSTGERASGWIVYYLAGPFILTVRASAIPGNDSEGALAAYADSVVPGLAAAVDALPAKLADAQG
jgi:hypothetical protein